NRRGDGYYRGQGIPIAVSSRGAHTRGAGAKQLARKPRRSRISRAAINPSSQYRIVVDLHGFTIAGSGAAPYQTLVKAWGHVGNEYFVPMRLSGYVYRFNQRFPQALTFHGFRHNDAGYPHFLTFVNNVHPQQRSPCELAIVLLNFDFNEMGLNVELVIVQILQVGSQYRL